ncbi:MAG: HisA/HisF-related TIM barrel protein [Burkholderiales bacterium]
MSKLNIIPVIDLMGGLVVHARQGRRSAYLPVQSKLCSSADPESVVGALLALHPFRTMYVADLDAILRRGDNLAGLGEIRRKFRRLELWVDSGISDEGALARWMQAGIGRAVIGSESMDDASFIQSARAMCAELPPVLSLDFMSAEFKGPKALLDEASVFWPERVLAMNLLRVGSSSGPDLALVEILKARAPDREVYASGGVRTAQDLERIAKIGAAGALIASALHDGRLATTDLERLDSG